MNNKVPIVIGVVVIAAVAVIYVSVAIVYSIARNAPPATQPTPVVSPAASTDQCPQINTLYPSAFARLPAGSCITLMPPAAMKPEPSIWCPVDGDLPLAGNRLNLIGEVITMLKREGDAFSVVTPDREKGVIFVPLEHRNGNVVLNGVSLFRERGNGHYTCLVDTLAPIP